MKKVTKRNQDNENYFALPLVTKNQIAFLMQETVESGENKAPTLLQFLRYSPHKQNLQTTNYEKQLSSSPLETFRNLFQQIPGNAFLIPAGRYIPTNVKQMNFKPTLRKAIISFICK